MRAAYEQHHTSRWNARGSRGEAHIELEVEALDTEVEKNWAVNRRPVQNHQSVHQMSESMKLASNADEVVVLVWMAGLQPPHSEKLQQGCQIARNTTKVTTRIQLYPNYTLTIPCHWGVTVCISPVTIVFRAAPRCFRRCLTILALSAVDDVPQFRMMGGCQVTVGPCLSW